MNRARKTAFYLIFLFSAAGLLLGAAEITLRVVGFGHTIAPFEIREMDDATVYVRSRAYVSRFFPWAVSSAMWEPVEISVLREKPAETYRVFVFGGSAALGWPGTRSEFAFSRVLEVLLKDRYPGVRFEVYNCAFTGVNSHAMRETAEMCAALSPDAFVVYMGNNEVHGPYGAVSGSQARAHVPDIAEVRADSRVQKLRLVQLATPGKIAAQRIREAASTTDDERLFLAPDDPRVLQVYENFSDNLEAIASAGSRAGAVVLLGTVAANKQHWAPAERDPSEGLTEADRQAWLGDIETARAAINAQDPARALETLARAARLDESPPQLHFLLGRAQYALGDFENARNEFDAALEGDNYGWVRAKAPINETIREVAGNAGAQLVEVVKAVEAASDHGIPGTRHFLDSCHLTFDGAYVVALAYEQALESMLPDWIREQRVPGELPDPETCASRIALMPDTQMEAWRAIVRSAKAMNRELLPEVKMHIDERNAALTGRDAPVDELDAVRDALVVMAPDYFLQLRLTEMYLNNNHPGEAIDAANALVRQFPYRRLAQRAYGSALALAGERQAADAQFAKALAWYPDDANAQIAWGQLARDEGAFAIAMERFRAAADWEPENRAAHLGIGSVYLAMGEIDQARACYEDAIDRESGMFPYYQALDELLQQHVAPDERVVRWQNYAERWKDSVYSAYELGKALADTGDLESAAGVYREALDRAESNRAVLLDPLVQTIVKQAEMALASGDNATGQRFLDEARDLSPDHRAVSTLEMLLAEDGGDIAALVEKRLAELLRAPNDESAYEALETALSRSTLVARLTAWRTVEAQTQGAPLALRHLSKTLREAGDLDGAIDALRGFQEKSAFPARVSAELGALLIERARQRGAQNNAEGASADLAAAQALGVTDPLASGKVDIEVLLGAGNVPAAAEAAEKIFAADPARYEAADLLDSVLRKRAAADREHNWERLSAQFPESIPARTYLGLAQTQTERFEASIATLESAQAIAPDDPRIPQYLADAWVARGQAYLAGESWDDAMSAFLTADALRPGDLAARQGQATVMVAQGNVAGARQIYEAAIAGEPDSFIYYRQLDDILLGEETRAERRDVWAKRVEADPLNPLPYVMLAQARFEQGDLVGALEAFQDGAEHDTGQLQLQSQIGMVYQKMAEEREQAGQLDDALQLYGQSLDTQPGQSSALQGQARVLLALGRADEARNIFLDLLAGQSENYTWYAGLNETWQTLPPEDRIQAWSDLAATYPTIVWPRYFLGVVLADSGKRGEAIGALQAARDRAPDNPQVRGALAGQQLLRAEDLQLAGEHQEAVKVFDALLEIQPRDQRGMLGRARALMAAGDEKAAADAYVALILAHDGYPLACRELAEYLARTKTAAEVAEIWTEISGQAPNIARVAFYRAQALSQVVRTADAVLAFEHAAENAGNDNVLLVEVSRALLQMEAWQAALDTLESAINVNPAMSTLRLDQLRCLVALGRPLEAEALREDLRQDGIEIPATLQ